MSEAATVAKFDSNRAATPIVMRVLVKGRIEKSRTHEGVRYTHVLTPAADAYSRPQLLEIRSKVKIGDTGEEISRFCTLGGYQRKAYQAKDKNTGEITTVVPVEHTLDLVESD